jgi:pilus assembly protein CpaC
VKTTTAKSNGGTFASRTPLRCLGLVLISSGVALAQSPASAKPQSALLNKTAAALAGGTLGGDFSSATPVEQKLHLLIGRSIFVNTKHRMVRVYVANPEMIDSYSATPNQVVLTAKKPGTSTVIVWDEAGETQSFVVSSDLDLTQLRESIKQAMPNENIQVQESEGHIMLTGTAGTTGISDAAVKLASSYSKDVANATVLNSSKIKQVKLKVRIVEVDRSKLNQFAFNFFSQGGKNIANTTTQQAPSNPVLAAAVAGFETLTTSNPLNFLFFNGAHNVGATLQDLQTMNLLQVLAEPEITTLSGQKANFLAGGEFPFPIVTGAGTATASVSISFRPYGVKLEFTPIVNIDGTIELKVAPEVSSLDYTNAVTLSGTTIPALSTRKAETQVVLRSGQTFAISGLLDKQTQDTMAATPGIASIPIIGQLFKSKNNNHSVQELYVIVTPTLVDPLTESYPVPDIQRAVPELDQKKFDNAVLKRDKDSK